MPASTDMPGAPAPEVQPMVGDGVLEGEVFGHLGAGGAALVVTVLLVVGVKGGGKGKVLPWWLVLGLGALAATLFAAAGGIWAAPADLLGALLGGLGIGGGGGGPLGNVGLGAVACILAVIIYWRSLSLKQYAVLGFIAAYVAGRAGGIWGAAAEAVEQVALMIGG